MDAKPHILIVDDEPNMRRVLGTLLEQSGFETTRCESGSQALDLVRAQDPDLVLTDLKMPGMDGMELLARLHTSFPEIPVIMLTAHGTVENAVEAMRRGAHDFITKPFDREHVVEILAKALGQAERGRKELRGTMGPGARCGFVGESAAIEKLRRTIGKVAPTPATVLIHGETGTGKELVAESLHALSPRAKKPLIKINCGALPENLVESELFGHERGAFTGADKAKPGRFELADGGTLFLDEIGELPLTMQVKLLRVLQDSIVDRVGGTVPKRVDVRLVTATNRDLGHEVAEGRFRDDLLYRLNVMELVVPPLRDHLDDIPLLVECFIERHAERLGRPKPTVTDEALSALASRLWPGNVRELENAVERAILLAESDRLTPLDFGLAPEEDAGEPRKDGGPTGSSLKEAARAAAAQTERRMIRAALETTGGNVTHAAEQLGLSRRGLQLKMKELDLR